MEEFPVKLCNKTYNVQTDVGVCVASDPAMILDERKIVPLSPDVTFSNGLRNVEHLMVINVNKLGSIDDFKVRLYVVKVNKMKCMVS